MEAICWMVVFLVLILIEMATLSLTTVWFAIGALFACCAAYFGAVWTTQFAIFIVVSIVVLFLLRPSAVRYFNQKRVKTNYESLIGMEAKVIETVNNDQLQGVAIVNGQEWTARAVVDDMIIEAGTKARIVKIVGVKLILSNQKEEVEQ